MEGPLGIVERLSLLLELGRETLKVARIEVLERNGQTVFPCIGPSGELEGSVFYLGPVGSDQRDISKWVAFRFDVGENDPWRV